MDYYIQGDAARAKEIKAAFQELGINVLDFGFADKTVVYCSIGECVQYLPYSINLMNILYSHPDYQELPLHVKSNPKFKPGTWLWHKEKGDFPVLIAGYDEKKGYLAKYNIGLETYLGRDIIENYYRLWEISDARNGDVLVDKYGNVGIYENMSELWWYSHIYFGCDGHLHGFEVVGCHIQKNAKPATSEQRDLLFAKMKEAGYTWDEKKRELKKITIKPMFKVGDWLYHNKEGVYPILITDYDENLGYQTECLSAKTYLRQEFVEKEYHLWTIEDAKPGDVLMCESGWTCIFKDLDLFNEMFSSYCSMTTCLDFMPLSSECHTLDSRINGKLTPATEKQHKLFFKKMKEAGYGWNPDKKELYIRNISRRVMY